MGGAVPPGLFLATCLDVTLAQIPLKTQGSDTVQQQCITYVAYSQSKLLLYERDWSIRRHVVSNCCTVNAHRATVENVTLSDDQDPHNTNTVKTHNELK